MAQYQNPSYMPTDPELPAHPYSSLLAGTQHASYGDSDDPLTFEDVILHPCYTDGIPACSKLIISVSKHI